MKFPSFIQAPMVGVQDHRLAVAVANHGGLGSLPLAMWSPEIMHKELTAFRTQSSGPVNVNFFCHTMPAPDEARMQAWCALLKPFADELGVTSLSSAAPLRLPFDEDGLRIVQTFRPEVVSFHFGLPDEHAMQAIKAAGSQVISSATTLEEALYLQSRGVDAVIAQGLEAGGHRAMFLHDDLATQLPTAVLLQQLVRRLQVPVIAAGGIGSAAEVRTALAAGALAVQVGSAFLLCEEATTSAVHRAALLRAQQALKNTDQDLPYTALTHLFSGRPARGLVNRLMREMGALHPQAPQFPYAAAPLTALRAASEKQGRDDFTPLWCGQNLTAPRQLKATEVMDQLWVV